MKKILLITLVFFFGIVLSAKTIVNYADTFINKGLYDYDTLKVTKHDPLTTEGSTKSKALKPTNMYIPFIEPNTKRNYQSVIKEHNYSKDDYRSLSDIFTFEPFAYTQDLGSFGQPNEQMFYGLGFGNISYISDGVLINNRWQNSYNLNKYSNELVDSIEIIPITKGFLYSTYNNPIAVNINTRFNFPARAITKLRFYQASYDEGFVNVVFHTPISKKLNMGINVSNSAIDSRFNNSDYESWKLNTQVNYQLNDKVNINFSYNYSYDTLALFGGLDTNKMLNDNYSKVLYENVNNSNSLRYQLTYNNNGAVKIIAMLIPYTKSDLTFYMNSTSQKYFQNKDTLVNNMKSIVNDNYYQTYGFSFRNIFELPFVSVDVIANYEISKFSTDVLYDNYKQNIFTISGDIKYIAKQKYFIPSVFAKLNNFNGKIIYGLGFDVSGTINNKLTYYAGTSLFQQQVSILQKNYENFPSVFPSLIDKNPLRIAENRTVELGLKFNLNYVFGNISYFSYEFCNQAIPMIVQKQNDSLLVNELSYFSEQKIANNGINLNLNFILWKIIVSNNFSYYFSNKDERVYASPDYTLVGKIYYENLLFENNLNLKTGIKYFFNGVQHPFVYDFEKLLQISTELSPMLNYSNVPSSFQLNLFLSGTIQERATIFVTLENVLDSEYYIVPYFIKQPITLRFGVSWLLYD